MEKIYIVWGQYADKSGHIFIRAFRDKGPAEELVEILESVNPSYQINIEEILYEHG